VRALPGIHQYGSRNWLDRNFALTQELGEDLDATQMWDNGSPPALIPSDVPAGDADCFAIGDMIADALGDDQVQDGYSPLCFLPASKSDLIWSTVADLKSCQMRKFWAAMLVWTYLGDTLAMDSAMYQLTGVNWTRRTGAVQGLFPAVSTFQFGGMIVITVSGTTNYQQLALQALYSLGTPTDFGVIDTNPTWATLSNNLLVALEQSGLTAGYRCLLVGHSYGAAGSLLTALRLKAGGAMQDVRYVTFGGPKPGGIKTAALGTTVRALNIQNDDDIVTALPPTLEEFYAPMISSGLFQIRPWQAWIGAGQVEVYNPAGVQVQREGPPFDSYQIITIANNVINGVPLAPINGHTMAEYLKRAFAGCPLPEPPVSANLNALLATAM
jgi:pimeloyl-ACP methyl ester carboxylesterase